MAKYHRITIEPKGDDFAAYGHGTYARWSVLAGQPKRVFLARGSVEALRADYPHADVLDCSTKPFHGFGASLADLSGLPATPPAWFDPADAGESW